MGYLKSKNQLHYCHERTMIRGVITAIKTIQETKITYYNFYNHFHPYVGELIGQLNKESLAGLFDVEFQSKCAEDFFKEEYEPNTSDDRLEVVYHEKEIDLSEGGPYSVYNT